MRDHSACAGCIDDKERIATSRFDNPIEQKKLILPTEGTEELRGC
jgi:hypothetical protein